MITLERCVKNALINYGAILPFWKVKIVSAEGLQGSDWIDVSCLVTRPKCRKPYGSWQLKVNVAREITDFSRSTFIKL